MDKIEIHNLNYKAKGVSILEKINLKIKKGSFTTVIGPVGSGKTTLFNLLINSHKKTKIDGFLTYIVTNPDRQIVARTVREQLEFFLNTYNYTKRQMTTRINNIVKEFKLSDLLECNPFDLSEGKKQLVILSSILVLDLDVLLIDNGLCRLDCQDKLLVVNYLKKLKKKKVTILNFTSNVEDILDGENVILLNHKIIFQDNVSKLINHENDFINNQLKFPFMLELSLKLKYYGLVDRVYTDKESLVNALWNL